MKRILMVTMTKGYGGAETHAAELCAGLIEKGARVRVITNEQEPSESGGLFAAALRKAGAEVIYAPLDSRRITDIYKSGRIIDKSLKEFLPDVVHAHARIPALAAKRVCKKRKIPLVVTAHGTYKTSLLLKFATCWGDYQLYVSDDIQDYLVKNYGAKKGSMLKTVNGINTRLFSPEVRCPEIRAELGIGADEKIILTVSRLDRESSLAAVKLCEIAPRIHAEYPNTRIVIVGWGDYAQTVSAAAAAANSALGSEYIIMTGAKTDIWRYVSECGISVGISRSALEALACGKTTVLFGDMGYLGIFTEEKSAAAVKTNFTCRGCGYPGDISGALLNDILFCMDGANADILSSAGEFSARLVRDGYSVERMVNDALHIYGLASTHYKKPDFVLTGFYGHDNIGDDALLFTVLNSIREKNSFCKVCVLSKNPRKMKNRLAEYFPNLEVLSRFNPFHLKKAVKSSSALVFGGGTLLQDNSSTKSLLYYLYLLQLAKKHGKKTILYANGIEVRRDKNKLRVYAAMKNISFASIRDSASFELLREMGIDESAYALTADEAIKISSANLFDSGAHDFRKFIGGKYFVISARKWKNLDSQFFSALAAAAENIAREHSLIPVYLVMEPKNDKSVLERLAAVSSRGRVIDTGGDIEKVLAVISQAEAVAAMRLHALIFAASFGVPMLGISYDSKVSQFISQIYGNVGFAVPLDEFSKELLTDKFRSLILGGENHRAQIESSVKYLRSRAAQNAEFFTEIMGYERL